MSLIGESFVPAKGEEQTTEERKVGVFERTDVCETVNQRNAVWGGDGGENVGVVEEGVRVFQRPSLGVVVHGRRRGVCVGGVEERVAILAGGLEGMGFGVNAVALLVTRVVER